MKYIAKFRKQKHSIENHKNRVSLSNVFDYTWHSALKFGKRTTLHGINRVFDKSTSITYRLIWLAILLTACIIGVRLCRIISNKYQNQRFETVIESTSDSVYNVHFPMITICNRNRLNWLRLNEAKNEFLGNETDIDKFSLFERILGTYDDLQFGEFHKFKSLHTESLQLLQHINFSLVVDFMSWHCDELFTNCIWNYKPMNCCELFLKRRSKSGLCYAFNTLEGQTESTDYPRRIVDSIPDSGLNFRVMINPEMHYPHRSNKKGIIFMLSEPYVWHAEPLFMPENTEVTVEIEPIIYFYDNSTRGVKLSKRECLFDEEHGNQHFETLKGYPYRFENCQSECHQQYLMQHCNCTMDLMFPVDKYVACKLKDLLCLADNNARFLYSQQAREKSYVRAHYEGMVCRCHRTCNALNYLFNIRTAMISNEVRENASYVDLNVHYRFETLIVYRTKLTFDWIDLLVGIGGITGLFLGCSMINTIELFYYFLIKLPLELYHLMKKT